MIIEEKKKEIIKKYAPKAGDTGSAQVQVAIFTERIKEISNHLKTHGKDYSSQLGLLKLVGQRRRLLDFLKRNDVQGYSDLVKSLEIRK